jgi:prepilin-type N-terminal cleavage/methylation domain-containing protein
MAAKPSQFSLVRLLLKSSRVTRRGFTLIELLVALVVGSLILGSLLYLVVELMQVNRREEVLGQTQQDMRRAIDYMTRDVREAVFVYSTPDAAVAESATLLEQLDGIPTEATPILAFWRLDPVDPDNDFWDIEDCEDTFGDEDKENECNTLKLRQSYYTLVIYLQEENEDDDLWGGPSRIIRYELPKYSANDIETLTQRIGYSDPTGCSSFAGWTRPDADCDADNVGETDPNIAVLTDYVNASPDGFSATVSDGSDNQTVRITLQGNATEGRPGLISTNSEAGRLPALEAEVLVRGILDKQPPETE